MKAKRIISSILVFVTLLSFAACSAPEPESVSETTAEPTETTATVAPATETTTLEPATEITEDTTETTAETTTETTTETTAETTAKTTTETTAEATAAAAEETTTAQPWWVEAMQIAPEDVRPDHPDLDPKDEKKPYYLKVNTLCNTVTVYAKDKDGYHTVPIKAMICSTGEATPQNEIHSLHKKGKWPWLALYGNVYGRYVTQINGDILFHSVPYLRYGDKGSLKYVEYDKLGTSCSMGCIRMTLEDAIWIYVNRSNIASVEFYSSEDPGPLGKPTAQIISQNETCRGWDPTDTDPTSPWLAKDGVIVTTQTAYSSLAPYIPYYPPVTTAATWTAATEPPEIGSETGSEETELSGEPAETTAEPETEANTETAAEPTPAETTTVQTTTPSTAE